MTPTQTLRTEIRSNRWTSVKFAKRLPFAVEQLTKLAKASDPRTSSLATYFDENGLFVWGLTDQGNRYFEYLNYDSESTQSRRPGTFQASIEGPAHVTVWMDFEKVAELRGAELAGTALDALDRGPLRRALAPGLRALVDATLTRQRENADALLALAGGTPDHDPSPADRDEEEPASNDAAEIGEDDRGDPADIEEGAGAPLDHDVAGRCLEALKRILIRAQNYGHGGAILVTPQSTSDDLNVKYRLDYTRLYDALVNSGAHRLDYFTCQEVIHEILDDERDDLPMDLYLDAAVAEDELNDARSEIEGVSWFISLLTRVDGLVLLTPDLRVVGFGVEITTRDEPESVLLASDAEMSSVSEIQPTHFGTRHRSMMRYCSRHPGSVGFVISQDGAVRGITHVGNSTVMWDNLKIQNYLAEETATRRESDLKRAAHD